MFKNVLFAAAALAMTVVPTVANAGVLTQKIHLLKDLKDAKRLKLLQLKADYQSGNSSLTKAEYLAKLNKLHDSIDRIATRVEKLKDRRASA